MPGTFVSVADTQSGIKSAYLSVVYNDSIPAVSKNGASLNPDPESSVLELSTARNGCLYTKNGPAAGYI